MIRKLAVTAALVLTAVPAVALADTPSPGDVANASRLCQDQRTAMTLATFKATYGTNHNRSNAFGKCVSKLAQAQQQDRQNAAQACRAEQGQTDAQFAATHDGKTFQQFYGTNKNGRNAFGRCVSTKAKASAEEQQQATINAAKSCRAERNASNFAATHGGKSFRDYYGTNANKSNAFGKCVSKKAKELQAHQ
jgi:hypothetical protein